ncbi:MAG: sigma-70 family RNA polymerase sigma factor [Planctomycetaceae bacterium]|nr:sigma-70 family RNA polymerase sigma factor [Planctomycetaceae bacterium]
MRSSRELSLEASQGGTAALEELLVRHLPRLRTYVRAKAGGLVLAREDASDIVQSVCREVLERAPGVRASTEAEFRAWLFKTTLRKILDKHKLHTADKRDVRREAEGVAGEDRMPDRRYASPTGAAIGHEELERLARGLDFLSEDQREVVLLSRVVGLSRAEVASEMGRTEASVRNLLHRALGELSGHLERGTDRAQP